MRGGKKLAGQRFGHWTAIERVGKNEKQHAIWLCRCDCGAEEVKTAGDLARRGENAACPECRRVMAGDFSRKHGGTGSKIHAAWLAMRKRCLDFQCAKFKHYGGRGIRIHEPWVEDFTSFRDYVLANLGEHPGKGFSLDRIDNDGHYEPGNIRWADSGTQVRNRRPRSEWSSRANRRTQQVTTTAEDAPAP